MNYIICDDNLIFAENFTKKILKIQPDAQIRIYTSLSEFSFKIEDIAESVNVVFMDIKQKDGNGIETWLAIAEKYPHIKVVYVTGYGEEFSQEIFSGPVSVTPAAFITKPVKEKYLRNALERVSASRVSQENHIAIKHRGETKFISPQTIFSVSSSGRKLIYTTDDGIFETYGNIKDITKNLPYFFVRCHNSHIVNIRRIKKTENWNSLELDNGVVFAISRTYRTAVKQAITRYC